MTGGYTVKMINNNRSTREILSDLEEVKAQLEEIASAQENLAGYVADIYSYVSDAEDAVGDIEIYMQEAQGRVELLVDDLTSQEINESANAD